MPEPIIASTQYGDFKGTVSMNGHGSSSGLNDFLQKRANLPPGYTLVGFEFNILWGWGGADLQSHSCYLSIYATKAVGHAGELSAFARNHAHIPVEKFRSEGEMKPEDLLELLGTMKEFSLVAATRSIEDAPMILMNE